MGAPRGEGVFREGLCVHSEAQACMGTCAEGCLANLKLGFGIHGVHILTLLTSASHINHILRLILWPLRTRARTQLLFLWLNCLFPKQNSLPQGLMFSPELCPGMVWGGDCLAGVKTSPGSVLRHVGSAGTVFQAII